MESAAPSARRATRQRVVAPVVSIALGLGLGGCELMAWFQDAPPPPVESAPVAYQAPAPRPPPPRPRSPAKPPVAAPAKAVPVARAPVMPAPARPSVPVASEPLAAITPPPAEPDMHGGAGQEPVQPPAAPAEPDIDPASLVGRSEAQLEQALGKPPRRERVASGTNWIYDRPDCQASFLLLPDVNSGQRRVFAFEVTPRGREAPSVAGCLGRIAAASQTRRS